ncbi:hypothetical protein [Sphingobium lignivorans]|uniref:Uncharacterized protein n=1 Tax=Sphingobium lignivorans TaxID=2735886 RepID=A0ABR6NFB4_9SPHN|nr:hypothetical protein [Sphingobium lignivorans]MBB5985970.1 hypothetical protein [Sphingobium lignivorans]
MTDQTTDAAVEPSDEDYALAIEIVKLHFRGAQIGSVVAVRDAAMLAARHRQAERQRAERAEKQLAEACNPAVLVEIGKAMNVDIIELYQRAFERGKLALDAAGYVRTAQTEGGEG